MDYISKHILNESIYRTSGDPNFLPYALQPSIHPSLTLQAYKISERMTNQNLNPSSKNRQYLLKMNGEVIDNVHYFTMLNKANLNRFDDWSDREYYSNNICLVSPIMSVNGIGYGCTCRRYLYEYVCEHSLAASIQTNSIPDDIKLDLPLRNQRRKKLGRPVKAVKGPYRLQPVELSNNQQRIETDGVNEIINKIKLKY